MCLNTSVCQTLAQTAEERSICKSVEINDTKMQQMLSRVLFFFFITVQNAAAAFDFI